MLAADNLRGKTSVLELITWCLRGSPRGNLQGVVRSWLSRLDCDVTVAGRLLGFRLVLKSGQLVQERSFRPPTKTAWPLPISRGRIKASYSSCTRPIRTRSPPWSAS